MLEEDGLARNQIHQLHLVFDFEFATALTTPGQDEFPKSSTRMTPPIESSG
jgi:hypothetical protein